MKHRGEIIERAVRESAYPITKLAEKLGVSRRHIYNLFESNKIDWDVIIQIGKIIRYDFSTDFPEIRADAPFFKLDEPELLYRTKQKKKKRTIEDCEEEIDYWRTKYITLLERYNVLLDMYSKKDDRVS